MATRRTPAAGRAGRAGSRAAAAPDRSRPPPRWAAAVRWAAPAPGSTAPALGRTQPPGMTQPPGWTQTAGDDTTAGEDTTAGADNGPATSPPAGPKPSRAAVSACSGSATNLSPTVASATREPGPLTAATGCASTGSPRSPGPNSSSTVMPSARAKPRATRSEGSEWPDSTADTACLVTPATPASCCWDRPRACLASRSRVPSSWEISVFPTSPSRGSDPYPKARQARTRPVTGWLPRATAVSPVPVAEQCPL